MAEQAPPPSTSGVTAADIIADPNKALADLRAEIKREIIGTNLLFLAAYWLIVDGGRPPRGFGRGL